MPTTFERPHRPPLVRVANLAGRLARPVKPRRLRLDVESIVEDARRATGLEDFGDAPGHDDALPAFLESLEREAKLTPVGRFCARGQALSALTNQLRMWNDRSTNPEIDHEVIERPLVVVGLPRSGTTLLQNLLAQDPAHRSLLQWEASTPSPPPETATYESDPRIASAERTTRFLDYLAPDARVLHPVAPLMPTECVTLFANSFASLELATINWIPSYLDWCLHADMRAHYRYYGQQLRLLQWRHKRTRWALKSPAHLFWIDALLAELPGVRIVQTHRDPLDVVASFCSLAAVLHAVGSDDVDVAALGARWTATWAEGLSRADDARAASPDAPVFDVHYRRLVAQPIETVAALYDSFGFELTTTAEERMRAFLRENPQHKGGVHRYSLAQFGLDEAAERERFAPYVERYAVETARS
jgi:hypothetical protein